MNEEPLALLPEALLLSGAIGGLLLGLFLPRRRQWLVRVVAAAALGGYAITMWLRRTSGAIGAMFGLTVVVELLALTLPPLGICRPRSLGGDRPAPGVLTVEETCANDSWSFVFDSFGEVSTLASPGVMLRLVEMMVEEVPGRRVAYEMNGSVARCLPFPFEGLAPVALA